MKFKPIWFDSLGAKSSCCFVKTSDVSVVIDPGISIMHKGFPASVAYKEKWESQGEKDIKKVCEKADIIIISHYHFDHFFPDDLELYKDKLLLIKNPNEYINRSQLRRAEDFLPRICRYFSNIRLTDIQVKRKKKKYENPLKSLPSAMSMDFGEYNSRRKQLLDRGVKKFKNMAKK